MKKLLFLLLGFLCLSLHAHAQVSYGGTPYSLGSNFTAMPLARVSLPTYQVPMLDMPSVRRQDRETINSNRFASATAVEVSPYTSGLWQDLPTGDRLWRVQIQLQGAEVSGMRLFFDAFILPEGGRLFIYSPNHQIMLGAFTEKSNRAHQNFATTLLNSQTIILEYIEPAGRQGQTQLHLNRIDQAYRQVGNMSKPRNDKSSINPTSPEDFGSSGSCNLNVNCTTLADNWRDEQRGAVRILTVDNSGSNYCSGSLIRNTNKDNKPYILTAYHCTEDATVAHLNNWTFDFNYQISNCNNQNTSPSNTQNITGSTMRGQYSPSDFALLELQENVPTTFNPYYNGWDRTGVSSAGAVCIHHPAGDVKKFTLDTDQNSTNSYYNDLPNDNTHFRQVWNNGTTEGGSSGSPLFNSTGNIIGQLHGGDAFCNAPNSPDWFGKVSVSWTGGSGAASRLSDWLDPTGSGASTLNGSNIETPTHIENNKLDSPFKVYPNPSNGLAYLAYEQGIWGGQTVAIALYQLTGKLAYEATYTLSTEVGKMAIPFKNLPTGMYILHIKTEKGIFKHKLMIE